MNNGLNHLIHFLENQARYAEDLISRTPSGDRRNALCDANIHVKAAIHELERAKELKV